MARVQATLKTRERLAPFLGGHAAGGAPIRRSRTSHGSLAFEPDLRRLLNLSPHIVERRAPPTQHFENLRTLEAALEGSCELRAGHAGISRFDLPPLENLTIRS